MKRSWRGALPAGVVGFAMLANAGAGFAASPVLSVFPGAGDTSDAAYRQPGAGGFDWGYLGQNADTGADRGQDLSLGYDSTDIAVHGKWDNRYNARGGMTFGATLDEARRRAIGGGFLTNEHASEFYGQYQFIAPGIDPLSSFTVGEYVSRENQSFSTGGADVWGYTSYLNWFKRSDSRQWVKPGVPASLRKALQAILDNTSALSGTLAYTYAPMVRQGDEGAPRTHAVDLSLRAVTLAPFGQYLPVSAGVGANYGHYNHVDDSTQNVVVGNSGMGVAFLGADYFKNPVHWLVGFGADGDTRGVVGATAAAELGPVSISYRQTSNHEQQVLASWRVSDLFSDRDRQHASTLAVSDGHAPLSFTSSDAGAGVPDRIAHAENGLARMGFMPPTGAEVSRPTSNDRGTGPTMQLSAASAGLQPQQVQAAIKRTQDFSRQVTSDKNAEIQRNKAGADTTAPSKVSEFFPSLTTAGSGFAGTMTFNEAVASVSGLGFVGGGGSVSITGGIGTTTLSFTGTTPFAATSQITLVVKDASNNARTVTSNTYNMF